MPLIKKRYAPKTKLVQRRRLARPMIRRMRNPNIYHFKRKFFVVDNYAVTAGSDLKAGLSFSLGQLPDFTDFTSLYDQYRINKVVVKLIPKVTQAVLEGGVAMLNQNLQQVHSAIDYDDVTAPNSISDLTQYQNHRMSRGNQIHTRVFVPKALTTIGAVSSAPKAKQWLDTSTSGIQHRGMKLFIPAPNSTGTTLYYDLECTMYLSFKNVV